MSAQLFFLPPIKHTPHETIFQETGTSASAVLPSTPRVRLLVELAVPFLGLSLANVFFFSIPTMAFFSVALLTSIVTLTTSPRASYVFFQKGALENPFWKQELLQKLMQWFVVLVNSFSLASSIPTSFFHIVIPLLVTTCIVWPILIKTCSEDSTVTQVFFLRRVNHLLWACSLITLFIGIINLSGFRTTAWTPYLLLSACTSFTLLCKDKQTEMKESDHTSKIKTYAHTALCLGILAYQAFSIFMNPPSSNIVPAILMPVILSIHILFVLLLDATQEVNDNTDAYKLQNITSHLRILLWDENDFLRLTPNLTSSFIKIQSLMALLNTQKTQPKVALWYFPTKVLYHAALGTSLLLTPMPFQPSAALLRAFYFSQIISTTTNYILKNIEALKRKRKWLETEKQLLRVLTYHFQPSEEPLP